MTDGQRVVTPRLLREDDGRLGSPIADEVRHPVFREFRRWSGYAGSDWDANWLGVKTRIAFFKRMRGTYSPPSGRTLEPDLPPFDEEYYEWISLLEAVVEAKGTFTMIELGAGWGRWLVNAAAAVMQHSGIPYHLVGVEAEPKHLRWLKQHMADNRIPEDAYEAVPVAIARRDGVVYFDVGDSSGWYGQSIANEPPTLTHRILGSVFPRARHRIEVAAMSLATLLHGRECVDLVDVDVQGVEDEVLEGGAEELDRAVKRVHVATHGSVQEDRIRRLFQGLGWKDLLDHPKGSTVDSPYGEMTFQDGVQSWRNPKL